jgi:hypothetical protein
VYAIRLPANDCLERDIAELQSKNLETWAKGCRGGKKRPEGIRRHTKIVAVLDPLAPGSTAGDLIVRYLGTQSELRQRIGALQWSLSAAASQSG